MTTKIFTLYSGQIERRCRAPRIATQVCKSSIKNSFEGNVPHAAAAAAAAAPDLEWAEEHGDEMQ